MFRRLLIANRGEIACRIARTARAMGMRVVAVHSEADADARHVRLADEARAIGPAPAGDSYLRGDAILEAARAAGADAIHPGYGFLSENAGFAAACAAAGIAFVGPSPEAIRAVGEKDSARRRMAAAGVPVLPGCDEDLRDLRALADRARLIGYPLLAKAVAGGGGRGMRRADSEAGLAEAVAGARREAQAAFGDDRVILEKFVPGARHVEVQAFGDAHGNVVHLFERECSIQRRYQKIVEEAPSPAVGPELRAALGAAAVRAARAVSYVGAGTVEFVVDGEGALHFLEMNARLQVEHPVTEAIVGIDLVEWQLRVAAGEPLPLRQEDIARSGHAVEARICAEDPARGFLPATGRIASFHEPADAGGAVRLDSGFAAGDVVTAHYDSLLAKLVVRGRDRESAVRRLAAALADTHIAGVAANLDWLRALAAHPVFVSGDYDTGFVDARGAELRTEPAPAPDSALAAAALFALLERRPRAPRSPWEAGDGWRLNADARDEVLLVDGERRVAVAVRGAGDDMEMTLPGGAVRVSGALEADGRVRARIGGATLTAEVARVADGGGGARLAVFVQGRAHEIGLADPLASAGGSEDESGGLAAPVPGKVVRLLCEAGARVRRGAPLAVVEAMKTEHTIAAPADGTVTRVEFAVGDWVDEGRSLVEFAADEGEPSGG